MVKWQGRKKSSNVKIGNTTFDDNRSVYGTKSKVNLPNVIDEDKIKASVALAQSNRMIHSPELVDTRFDEYYSYGNGNIRVVPREFLLDTFKKARQSGLKMPWNEFRKAK